jgi:hypothetical protein
MPESNRMDTAVEQFIQYDIGRLSGTHGQQVRLAFNRLGAESIPAVVRGLNRAAILSQSCPIIVLKSKLKSLLQQSDDTSMLELAIDHLGEGVPATAPYYRALESLHQELLAMLPPSHPKRRILELMVSYRNEPSQLSEHLRSDVPEERLAAVRVIRVLGLPLGDDLLRMLNDPEPAICQEARSCLCAMARGLDFGPAPNASAEERARALEQWHSWWAKRAGTNSVFHEIAKLPDDGLRDALHDPDPNKRWAAVVVMRARKLSCDEELISLLRDHDLAVRREARQSLAQLANGRDFGPSEDADDAAIEQAVRQWEQWRTLHNTVTKFETLGLAQIMDKIQDKDTLTRLAALMVAHRRGINLGERLLALIRDKAPEIRQEARRTLVELANGTDFGPSENSDLIAAEESAGRWQKWLAWHDQVLAYRRDEPSVLLVRLNDADASKRWAAVAVVKARRLSVPDKLIPLLRDANSDVQQEARQALAELARDCDFGPSQGADSAEVARAVASWTKWIEREKFMPRYASVSSEDLALSFRSTNPGQRWAAVAAARRRHEHMEDAFILLLCDPDNEIRQESRAAMKQLADGLDFGPLDNALEDQCQDASQKWSDWWNQKKARSEEAAKSKLKMAETLVAANPPAAKRRLEEIVQKYPGTNASRRAHELLRKLASAQPAPSPAKEEKPSLEQSTRK